MSEFLRYSGEKGQMKKYRRMGQGSVKLLNAKLLCFDFSQCLESDGVEFVSRSFNETFQNALNETCPLVKKRCKKCLVPVKPWITRGLLKSIEEKY